MNALHVGALVIAFVAGAAFWAGAFPYASGPVPRAALMTCGGALLAVAVVVMAVWT